MLILGLTQALAASPPDIDEPLRTGLKSPTDAAVVIGLEDYAFLPSVPYAGRDARAVADFLISSRGVPLERVRVIEAAGREQIVAALSEAGGAVGPDGVVWVYFAGHGAASPSSGARLLLGDDVRRAPEGFEARSVSIDEVTALASVGGGRVVLFVDACFNGTSRSGEAVIDGTRFAVPDWQGQPAAETLHWTASGPDQLARPLDAVQHGAFTYLALGALRGWADGEIDGARDGQVTADEAQLFLSRSLPTLGLSEQQPQLRALDPASWVLARAAPERRPSLDADSFVSIRPPAAPTVGAVTASGWDPNLFAKATTLGIQLPLRHGTFGYKDAAGERVRGAEYMSLVRSTKKGRSAIAQRSAGLVGTSVGWIGVIAFGTVALVTESAATRTSTGIGAAASGALSVTGIGFLLAGQTGIQRAVEPLPSQ